MGVIHIDLPESVLLTTGQSQEEFVREAKFLLALKLFEMGRMSSGVAAEVSGIRRVDFLLRASQAAVPVADLDEEELDREFRDLLEDMGRRGYYLSERLVERACTEAGE